MNDLTEHYYKICKNISKQFFATIVFKLKKHFFQGFSCLTQTVKTLPSNSVFKLNCFFANAVKWLGETQKIRVL